MRIKLLVLAMSFMVLPALGKRHFAARPDETFRFVSHDEITHRLMTTWPHEVYASAFMEDHEYFFVEFVKRLDHGNYVEQHTHWIDQTTILSGEAIFTYGGTIPTARTSARASFVDTANRRKNNTPAPRRLCADPFRHAASFRCPSGQGAQLRRVQAPGLGFARGCASRPDEAPARGTRVSGKCGGTRRAKRRKAPGRGRELHRGGHRTRDAGWQSGNGQNTWETCPYAANDRRGPLNDA